MDKNEKLALARKKLKKFQARTSPHPQPVKKAGGGVRGSQQQHSKSGSGPSTINASSTETTETVVVSKSQSPPPTNNARLSSAEGLREISQEITSLLSESALRQTSTPIRPAPQSTASSSSSSFVTSLPMLAPPTMTSSLTAAAPIPPASLGTSTASSMSDLHVVANNHQIDTPTMFRSGSTASLGSSTIPLLSAGEALYAGGLSLDHTHKQNGHSNGSFGERNGFSNPSLSLVANSELQTEGDTTDTAPSLVPHTFDSNLLTNDRGGLAPPSDVVMESQPVVDFQIGTPQYQRSSPADSEKEVTALIHDGHLTPTFTHTGAGVGRAAQQLSISDVERIELEQKIQAHAQTIDILVSEKSKLQTELSRLQTQLDNRQREWEDGQSHLKSTRRSLEELEHGKHLMSEELSHKQKAFSQSQTENKKLKENAEKMRAMLEDQQEENTELISKITAQSAEISSVKNANVELQSKLGMAELLVQQLSGDSAPQATPTRPDPALEEELKKVRGEVAQLKSRLQQVTSEREQVNSDLSALRDAMILQQEENTQKLAEAQTKLAESSALVDSLSEEMENLKRQKDAMSERVSTEHAQFELTNQVAMETLQQERDDLENQLQQRIYENTQLTKENSELGDRSLELECELSRLKEQSIDHHSLLTTMAQDKETLSRAMSQNKELKANVAELQDAFVRLSNQNMELASQLETERHSVSQLNMSLAAGQHESPPSPLPPVSEGSMIESGSGQTTPMQIQTTPISDDSEKSVEVVDEVKGQERAKLREQEEQIESLISERSQLHAQLQVLESEHNRSLDECRNVQLQLEELSQQHQQLLRETREEEERREEAKSKRHNDMEFSPIEEDTFDVTQLSEEQLLQLQSNFKALQRKFVSLMSEKAELLERVQEYEHVIVQLSVETETIGEYIALYQTQRESLKVKFMEKDLFIEQLTNEKAAIQNKLYELQVLLKQLLSQRSHESGDHHQVQRPLTRPTKLSTSAFPLTPSPVHSPTTDLPIHLRPVTSQNLSLAVEEHEISSSFSFSRLHGEQEDDEEGEEVVEEVDGPVRSDGGEMAEHRHHSFSVRTKSLEKERSREDRAENDDRVTSVTAEQIMHLIGQLEMTTSGANRHVAPCSCCTGELTVV